MISLFNFRV